MRMILSTMAGSLYLACASEALAAADKSAPDAIWRTPLQRISKVRQARPPHMSESVP